MSQVLYPNPNATSRRSLAACVPPPPRKETTKTKEIQERSLKHIEEITKDLGPPQGEELTYEQQEWLNFRMVLYRPFPKPYRRFAPIVIPYRWEEQETDQ